MSPPPHTTNSLIEVGGQGKWSFADSNPQVSGLGTVSFNVHSRNPPQSLKSSGALALDTCEEGVRLGEKTWLSLH